MGKETLDLYTAPLRPGDLLSSPQDEPLLIVKVKAHGRCREVEMVNLVTGKPWAWSHIVGDEETPRRVSMFRLLALAGPP